MLGEGALTAADAARYLEAYRQAIHAIGAARPVRGRVRRAQHLGQAVGAASALRARQARARAGRTGAALLELAQLAKALRHRLHHRRRGSRSPGTVAGPDRRGACSDHVARRLGRLRPRGAGLPEARAVRDRLPRRPGAPRRPAHAGAPGQGRVLGRGGQARAGRRPCRAIRCSRASRTPTCPTSPARGACSTHGDALYPMFATHNAQTIAAIHHIAARPRRIEFQSCTAWATTCTPK